MRFKTVLNSSGRTGRRRNSRAPARKLRSIKSGEASGEAQMMAVEGHSEATRSTNFSPDSGDCPRATMAAEGRSRSISAKSCSASSPPARMRAPGSAASAPRSCLKVSRPLLRMTNVSCWDIFLTPRGKRRRSSPRRQFGMMLHGACGFALPMSQGT